MNLFKGKFRVPSARLNGWDYASPGYYFVTICTKGHHLFFGEIHHEEVHLSQLGEIAHDFWLDIPNHFKHVDLDEFVIMPNHMHGIVIINEGEAMKTQHNTVETQHDTVETQHAASLLQNTPTQGSLSVIVRSYKSAVTRWARLNSHPDFAWQARFYDHIIRSEQSLNKIRAYIRGNPVIWEKDEYHP